MTKVKWERAGVPLKKGDRQDAASENLLTLSDLLATSEETILLSQKGYVDFPLAHIKQNSGSTNV